MTRASPRGLPPPTFLFLSAIQRDTPDFYPPTCVFVYVARARESYPFFPRHFFSLLSGGGVRQRQRQGIAAGPPPLQPPPPPSSTSPPPPPTPPPRRDSSIRNDENSADLTKSFQELSRRLSVLVNSGYRLASLSHPCTLVATSASGLVSKTLAPLPLLLPLLHLFRVSRVNGFFSFFFSCAHFAARERENVLKINVTKYVHGGDTRRRKRHVLRDAFVRLASSALRPCRERSVSRDDFYSCREPKSKFYNRFFPCHA